MALRDWLASDDFELALSSGFFGFYAHAGFLQALAEAGIRPAGVSGASAGALVGGCYASGLDPEVIRDELLGLQRSDFWDPGLGLGLLRGRKFHERLKALLPVQHIEDCPVPLAISVYDPKRRTTLSLRQGCLPTAIRASCAFPFLFHPVRVGGAVCLDGGIADGRGLAGIKGDRILYHHLPSTRFWGKLSDRHADLPKRRGLHTVIPEDIPAVGPFRMERGRDAFHVAYQHGRYCLESSGHYA